MDIKCSSVYIHIPFCKKICAYCDFCKVLYNEKWVKDYLESLQREIKERYMGESIRTIYIGGGTPSCLSLSEIEYLLNITNIFQKDNLEEFTFECNIEDINMQLLNLLKRYKVDRLSIGIESFDPNNLKLMQRNTKFEEVKEKMALIREVGFNNVNLDLMYALPNEKLSTLKKDLKLILKLAPDHISTYSLIVEDNTYFAHHHIKNISEEIDASMYFYIKKVLEKNGFNHYEIANFAKEGKASLHNLVYWNNLEYYGFGCGASGYYEGVRYDNTKSLTNYLKGEIVLNEEILSKENIMEYELILGLRKIDGINIREFYQKYGQNIQDVFPIKPLLQSKDLIYENNHLKINPQKIYVMNEILLKLV